MFALAVGIGLAQPVHGATRTWTGLGPTNNWNDALNWSGNAVPGAADVATFDGTSSKNATINVAANVSGFTIAAGYGGTITQAAGITLTVGATGFSQGAGTVTGGTAAITVNGPFTIGGGSFAATTGTLSISGAYTHTAGGSFAPGTGTVALTGGAATFDVGASETFNNLTFSAGAKTVTAGQTLVVAGTLTLTNGSLNVGTVAAQGAISQASTFGAGTGTLLINGAAAQTFTGAATTGAGNLPALVINKPSGTLTLAGTIRTANPWTYTAGTVDPGTSLVVFAGGTVTGSHVLANVDLRATTSIAAGTVLTVGGTFNDVAGNLNGTGTLAAQGPLTQASTSGAGTATLLINGVAAQTFTGGATTGAGNLPPLVINKPSGTLTLAGTIRDGNGWTYTSGTVDPAASTVVFAGGTVTGSHTLGALDFRATTTIAAGTTLTAAGSVNLSVGNLNTGTLAALADVNQALGYGGGSGTLLMAGAGAQTLTGASTTASGNLPLMLINKPSGTLTLAGTIRTSNNWTYSAGTLSAAGSTVVFAGGTVTGSHGLNVLDFRATTTIAAGTTLTASGGVSLTAGNLNGTGTLEAQADVSQALGYGGGTATLLLDGAGAQTLTGASTTASGNLPLLVINKPSGSLTLAGTIRTSNSWTYVAGTLNVAGSLVVFSGSLTITGSHGLNDVTFNGGNSNYTLAAGTTLTVTGSLTLTDGNINTGTVAAQGPISQASTFDGNSGTLLISGAGAQTFTGAATTAAGSLPNVDLNKPSGTLTLAGTIRTTHNWTYTAGALDPGTSLVVFAGTLAITGSHSLANVTFNGGNSTYTLGAVTALTVTGVLTLTDGNINTGTVAAQGDVSQASTFDGNSGTLLINGAGAQMFSGAATTAAGSLPNVVINKPSSTLTLAGTIRTTHNWTYSAGTVDSGTSTVVFAGSTVTSVGMVFYDVVSSGGTTTLGSAMSVGHDLTVSAGTFTTSATNLGLTVVGNLTVTGTFRANGSTVTVQGNVVGSGSFVAGTSTLTLNGTAGQALAGTAAFTVYNLIVNDPAGVSLGANVTVSSVLTLTAGTLTVGANTLTISNPIAGILGNLVADGTSSITVTGAAAGITLPASITQLNRLTLANASGLLLQGDLTIQGTLTLTSGPVSTGGATVVIAPAASVVRTGGRVNGKLQKHVVAGAGVALTFEVGDASSYTPVAISFGAVTTPGELTASTTAGEHPDIANAGLDAAHDVNRYWTVTNAGTLFDSYDATFTFVASDRDPGTTPANFIVAKLDGTTWTLPAVGTRTALSTQAIGLTSFSDFALGEPTADLAVSASDGVASVTAGDGLPYGYLVTVANGGPSDAAAVSLTISWPTGFSQGLVAPSQGTCSPLGAGPDLSCDLGLIGAGASATVSLAYTVPAATPGGLQTLTASVTSATADPDPADNAASDTTLVLEAATLTLTKDDGLANVVAGTGGHAYTLTLSNGGPSDADAVSVTDSVPGAFTAGVPSADLGGDCSASSGNVISCSLPASLAPGATWTITVPYVVAPAVAAQTVTNTALATSAENPLGVSASDTTDVLTSADLAVSASDGVASVTAGDGLPYGYLVTVANGGPSDAAAVSLTISWPTGFSQGLVAPSQGTCSPLGAGPDLSCDLGLIGAGASATVSLAYTVPAATPGGLQTLTASVTSATADPDPADNAASDTTLVLEAATLTLTKDDGLANVVAGTGGHAYTLTLSNGGPSDADAVSVTDSVPGAFTAGVPSADLGGDCSASSGNVISCSLPASLAPGATWTITVPYVVAPAVAAQTVTNTALATSAENPLGVSASDTTDVLEAPSPSPTGSESALPTLPASDAPQVPGPSQGVLLLSLGGLLLLAVATALVARRRRA